MKKLKIELFKENSITPKKNHNSDAGYDLYSTETKWLFPFFPRLICIGIKTEIEDNYVGIIKDRSSMGKKGIHVLGGVIDSGFLGVWHVILINLTFVPRMIRKYDRIAQALFMKIESPKIVIENLNCNTDRGEKGFGSSN